MTPLTINILMNCHTSPAKVENRDTQAVNATLRNMVEDGLIIESNRDCFTTTERGAAHVTQLCNLPLPVRVWAGIDGEVIKREG